MRALFSAKTGNLNFGQKPCAFSPETNRDQQNKYTYIVTWLASSTQRAPDFTARIWSEALPWRLFELRLNEERNNLCYKTVLIT